MKSIKTIHATALARAIAAPSAFAQASHFQGFHLGGNLDLAQSTSSTNFARRDGSIKSNSATTSTGMGLSLEGKYQHAFGEKFVLGAGAKIDLVSPDNGSHYDNKYPLKPRDAHTLYIAPGMAINDKVLAYLKLGKSSRAMSIGDSFSTSQSGNHVGFGMQYQLTPSLYMLTELSKVDYGSKEISENLAVYSRDFASDYSTFTVGLGYKF